MTSFTIKTRRLFSDVSGDLHAQESRRKDRKLLDNITNKLYDMDNALVRPSDSITEVVSDVRRRLSGRELAPHTDLRLTKHRLRNASRAKVESDILNSLIAHLPSATLSYTDNGSHVTPTLNGNNFTPPSTSSHGNSAKPRYKRHHSAFELHRPKLSSIIECDEDAVDGVTVDGTSAHHVSAGAGGEPGLSLASSGVLLAADRALLLARQDIATPSKRRDVRDKPSPVPGSQVTPVTPSVQRVKRTVSEPLQPAIYPSYISTGHTTRSTALPPTAELAVRTARRCLSRLETELAGRNYADADDFDVPLRSRTLTQQSYKKPPVMPASYYLDDLDLDDDYYVPVSVPVRGRSLARTTPLAGAGAGGLSVRQTVRHRSLTPSKPAVTVTRRHLSSIDDDLDYEPPSYAGLRAKYTEAKNKLDLHKTMLDKYLPLYLGPENAVEIEVDYKFGELCARMPRLDPYRPLMNTNNNTLSSSKPPRGRPLNNFEKPTATHPKMSDTRKRVRDVICKTRNDKHYYD